MGGYQCVVVTYAKIGVGEEKRVRLNVCFCFGTDTDTRARALARGSRGADVARSVKSVQLSAGIDGGSGEGEIAISGGSFGRFLMG